MLSRNRILQNISYTAHESHFMHAFPGIPVRVSSSSVEKTVRIIYTDVNDLSEGTFMGKELWKTKSFNFTSWNAAKTDIEEAKKQIDSMVSGCSVNTVAITFAARQDHCYSTEIHWKGSHMFDEPKLAELITHAKNAGLRVIVKPMLNVSDGYWRAYIRFFDEDVPCEPKWHDWFREYTDYIVHYARLCDRYGADMLIIGCELVGTDHRHREWRRLIESVRSVYSGLLSYNCDKYQEHRVTWWDALDAISSSGYYPINDWDRQLARIYDTVTIYNKPFFFAETGCPSTAGASMVPNDWNIIGRKETDLAEQNDFFRTMFEKSSVLDWHYGYCIWDWPMNLPAGYCPGKDGGYYVMGKPAQETIRHYFSKW